MQKAKEPVAASALLSVLSPFLLSFLRDQAINRRSKTYEIEFLMEEWYVKQPKSDIESLCDYPSSSYPDTCFSCGNGLSIDGSILRMSCFRCKSPSDYTADFYSSWCEHRYHIHRQQVIKHLSTANWNLYHARNRNRNRQS